MSPLHACALEMELHIGTANSLKAKRAVVRHVIEVARNRYGVSASEVDHHDRWQLASIAFCVVAPSAGRVVEILDRAERFVWAHPEVEVVSSARHWLDTDT